MKYFYTIFFIIVTYLAVGSSAIRYFVYDIESHASKVSNYIENNIEKNIKISSLKGYWQGLNPKISFNASKVSDNKDLGQIIVQLNLFQTLSTFQPVIKYIFVDGLNISLNFSDSKNDLKSAIKSLKFDEHFFLQLLVALKKYNICLLYTSDAADE